MDEQIFWEEIKKDVKTIPSSINGGPHSHIEHIRRQTRTFMYDRKYNDYETFLSQLRINKELKEEYINTLHIHETYFFREYKQFELLNQKILKEILYKRKSLNVWSAACSTGEEYYSIMMMLLYTSFIYPNNSIKILGSDISTLALGIASSGKYPESSLRNLEDKNERLHKIFMTCYNLERGYYVPNRFFKEFCDNNGSLMKIDLMTDSYPEYQDVIFLRNILFYFDTEQVKHILKKVYDSLSSDGYLFLSSVEISSPSVECCGFKKEEIDGCTVLRKQERY